MSCKRCLVISHTAAVELEKKIPSMQLLGGGKGEKSVIKSLMSYFKRGNKRRIS